MLRSSSPRADDPTPRSLQGVSATNSIWDGQDTGFLDHHQIKDFQIDFDPKSCYKSGDDSGVLLTTPDHFAPPTEKWLATASELDFIEARPEGLEPPTVGSEVRCSIH